LRGKKKKKQKADSKGEIGMGVRGGGKGGVSSTGGRTRRNGASRKKRKGSEREWNHPPGKERVRVLPGRKKGIYLKRSRSKEGRIEGGSAGKGNGGLLI